jgi:hypothetical protein
MTTLTDDTPTIAQTTTTTIPGVVLARADAPPSRPDGTYGVAWLMRTPLRAGGWLALALLWSVPLTLALAFWLAATPRRAAVTAAASLLAAAAIR